MKVDGMSKFFRGLWHSMRGLFTGVYYNELPSNSSPATSSAIKQVGLPLTELVQRRRRDQELQAQTTKQIKKPEMPLRQLILVFLFVNSLKASLNVWSLPLIELSRHSVPINYWYIVTITAGLIHVMLFIASVFSQHFTNMVLQNRMASTLYVQVVGRVKVRDLADAGGDH